MYHYDPKLALEEFSDESVLVNPVHVRDMIVRAKLSPDQALELNREFLTYMKTFADAQKQLKPILEQLALAERK